MFVRGGLALLRIPDHFIENPEFWFNFNLSTLAAFPNLAVVPILPENPSNSILSFAKHCPAELSYRSTVQEYAAVILKFINPKSYRRQLQLAIYERHPAEYLGAIHPT